MRRWESTTRKITGALLDDFLLQGGDWVAQVSAPLPIRVILSVLGVSIEDADYLVELSNCLVEGTSDQRILARDAYGNTADLPLLPFSSPASHASFEYGERLGSARISSPRPDLMSKLATAHGIAGGLTRSEFLKMFHVLVFAGNETTRTAMSHAAIAFADQSQAWQQLRDDPSLFASAVEQTLRWSTPVLHMRRTATRATTLANTHINAGDKVVMWYASANFDDAPFTDPQQFDITRARNTQFSFGGGRPHLCLGAFLARREIRVLFEEMLKRQIVLVRKGEPQRVASNCVNGVVAAAMEPK